MLEKINSNCRMLSDSQEIKILEYYDQQGKKFTVIIICNSISFLFTYKRQ